MARFETAKFTAAYRGRGEDRVAVFDEGERTILVVSDGAGGVGQGDVAAETVIYEVESACSRAKTAEQWTAELKQIDCRIPAGEATAVVVDLRPDGICGASVGDSQAWLIHDGGLVNLTSGQVRKPLLGTGDARPVGFSHPRLNGLLLMATDGFCNYVNRQELPPMIARTDFFAIPRTCAEMVRLPSGDLWDDIGIVACRRRPARRTKRSYVIG